MTDAPKPPKRRRRKIIVALALVLMSLSAWWFWPRGDARFVGKWQFWMGSPPSVMSIMRFDSNGSGAAFGENGKWISPLPWTIDGNDLVVGYQHTAVGTVLAKISMEVYDLFGFCPFYPDPLERIRIMTWDENTIELDHGKFGRATLRRIPE